MSEEEVIVPLPKIEWDVYDEEEEVCEHEWQVERVTQWDMNGSHSIHVCVEIRCAECGVEGNTDCSWEFTDNEVM